MDIQAKEVKSLLFNVYKRYRSGSITEAQASRETAILNSILKAIEITDLEQRVDKLEEINIINLGNGVKP
jgi:hypothetical protein